MIACWRAANGARPSTSNTSVGSAVEAFGDARRMAQTTKKNSPSTSAKLPATVVADDSPSGRLLVSVWFAELWGFSAGGCRRRHLGRQVGRIRRQQNQCDG